MSARVRKPGLLAPAGMRFRVPHGAPTRRELWGRLGVVLGPDNPGSVLVEIDGVTYSGLPALKAALWKEEQA